MSTLSDQAPFSRIKIRPGALVFCGEDVALIRRDRPSGSHYTPPGGNVEPGEDILGALARELAEELTSAWPTPPHPSCAGSRTRWCPVLVRPPRPANCT